MRNIYIIPVNLQEKAINAREYSFKRKNLMNEAEFHKEEESSPVKLNEWDNFTFNRVYMEKIVYLNKSNAKWFSFGVKPHLNGIFSPIIRLFDRKGFYITFTPKQFKNLLNIFKQIPQLSDKVKTEIKEKAETDEFFNLKQSNQFKEVFILTNASSERAQIMMIGLKTIERVVELEDVLREYMNEINEEFVKYCFLEIIRRAKMIYHKTDDYEERIKQFILKHAVTADEGGITPRRVSVIQETALLFDEFLISYLKQNVHNIL